MHGKNYSIFDSKNWEALWEQAGMARRKKTGLGPGKEAETWDKRAGHFDKKVHGKEGSERVEAIINFLQAEGVFTAPDISVLDIGCGQGTITLELARHAGQVHALDPSEKMLQLLKNKLDNNSIKNVGTLQARWQEIDLEEKGWLQAFDLTFASMSPGVNDAENLEKMMDASRKYCYLSTFAGRKDKPRDELWEMITGQPFEPGDLDIIYPLNLLYTWGFRPSLRFYRHHRSDWIPLEDAVENLLQYLHVATDHGGKAREIVEDYVAARQEKGSFFHQRDIFHGMLLWDKTVRTS